MPISIDIYVHSQVDFRDESCSLRGPSYKNISGENSSERDAVVAGSGGDQQLNVTRKCLILVLVLLSGI